MRGLLRLKMNRSLPLPPVRLSAPNPPVSVSFPAPPLKVSAPTPLCRLSLPAPPVRLSAPSPPTATILYAPIGLPFRMKLSAWPCADALKFTTPPKLTDVKMALFSVKFTAPPAPITKSSTPVTVAAPNVTVVLPLISSLSCVPAPPLMVSPAFNADPALMRSSLEPAETVSFPPVVIISWSAVPEPVSVSLPAVSRRNNDPSAKTRLLSSNCAAVRLESCAEEPLQVTTRLLPDWVRLSNAALKPLLKFRKSLAGLNDTVVLIIDEKLNVAMKRSY